MPKYAIVLSGIVENVEVWDAPPVKPGRTVVLLSASQIVSPGDSYNGVTFTPRVLSAKEIEANEAPSALADNLVRLRLWANDAQDLAALTAMTAAQRLARQAVIEDRFAKLCRIVAYAIRQQGVSD